MDLNPSRLGDPVSLKAETSQSDMYKGDVAGKSKKRNMKHARPDDAGKLPLRARRMQGRNASMLGDPISLVAERPDREGEEMARESPKPKL